MNLKQSGTISPIIRALCLTCLLLTAVPGHAIVVNATVSFDIDVLVDPNDFATDFGLTSGDVVTVTATYDDAVLTGTGIESILLDAPGAFSITIGSLTLAETDDLDFGGGFLPAIDFEDGAFFRFQFLAEVDAGAGPDLYEVALEDFFEVIRLSDDALVIENIGAIDDTTVMISPIPVPAALPLLGTALAALFGLGVRRRRS